MPFTHKFDYMIEARNEKERYRGFEESLKIYITKDVLTEGDHRSSHKTGIIEVEAVSVGILGMVHRSNAEGSWSASRNPALLPSTGRWPVHQSKLMWLSSWEAWIITARMGGLDSKDR